MAKAIVRQSIYRILSDLVKSDNIITVDELDALDEACDRRSISERDREDGFKMTLAEALRTIASQGERTRASLLKSMEDIALKDGECCRQESLLITAAEYVCRCAGAESTGARVVSMEFRNRPLLTTQLLYVENRETISARATLDTAFDEVSQIVKMGGMDLIYIPRIAQRFREYETKKEGGVIKDTKRHEDLKRMLRLVSPTSSDADLENTITAIQGMNSRNFFSIVLNGKLEMGLDIEKPCWMLRLPDSVVEGRGYANFFLMDVDKDIRMQLRRFVDRVNLRQNSYSITVNDGRGKEGNFSYNGFYKALLDVMSVRKVDKWDLHVRLYGEGVPAFEYEDPATGTRKKCAATIKRGLDEYPLPMTGRDLAFYLLLLCASASAEGGVDFGKDGPKHRIEARYSAIYGRVSRREKNPPTVYDPEFRIPMRSRVAKLINESEVAKNSSLQALYLPEEMNKKGSGFLRVGLEPERVVIHSINGTATLTNSDLYRTCFLAK